MMGFIIGLFMGTCIGGILMAILTIAADDDIRNGRK